MNPVETYFSELNRIRSTGAAVPETSYYGVLANLLNEIGDTLKPKIVCVVNPSNRGAGIPDGGLFSANQSQRITDENLLKGQLPERGVIEIKSPREDVFLIAKSEQVSRYWRHYGQVLVTNYREFAVIGTDHENEATLLETFQFAPDEPSFWELADHPRRSAELLGERFVEFLKRTLLQNVPLTAPEDVAWFLASYAREARARLEMAADLPALENLKKGLEDALGMTFEGDKGAHFFRATLIQTLFYGVFSSWVLWVRDHWGDTQPRFNWHEAGWTLHVPMIASLFSQIATPQKLKPLRIDETLDWTGNVLNRVDRIAFFDKFEEAYAVQYFYEPFLQAYNPELRKSLGVWYTPPEIVQYQVERVDRVLREELDIADGLADPRVVILDPCCGTGAYLVETLRRIHETLEELGSGALLAQKLKQAAKERVFGFEILPAPFVVAHLQLGLMLRRLGAPLDHNTDERAGVFLTNALTGWEPVEEPKNRLLPFPEFMEERDAANKVKQQTPILVVLGNPPYNAFAGVSPAEEGGLVDVYKEGLTTSVDRGGWGIKKFNLDDLYIRFFRIAERRIARSGNGIVCYISNFSYLSDPSFVAMRQCLLTEFDKLWFDCMNGDSRETGKLTPDGKPDPSVFSTETSPVGIRVGTAVCVLVRKRQRAKTPTVRFQDFWGTEKRKHLLASLKSKTFEKKYQTAKPTKFNRFSFRPSRVTKTYREWPNVIELAEIPPFNGLMEKRGGALMDIDRHVLEERMRVYFDTSIEWREYAAMGLGLDEKRAGISPSIVRNNALKEGFRVEHIIRYMIRPFDAVWAYYSPVPGVWNRSRPAYWEQCWKGNSHFVTRPAGVAHPEGVPVYYSPVLGDNDFQRGHAYYFPFFVRLGCPPPRVERNGQCVFEEAEPYCVTKANLSKKSRDYLHALNMNEPDVNPETASLIWMHALAIGFSPAYLAENADGIRSDWPRIPLPATGEMLLASAQLGKRIAELLDTETPVPSVTSGRIEPLLKKIGTIAKTGGGALDPLRGELDVTAGWGHGGQSGVCMPGKGKWIAREQMDASLRAAFGAETLDIYLNDAAYWENVPKPVWEYVIGGYQVLKKWLSYREIEMLGRGLTIEETEYVSETVRRLAAIVLLQPALDKNYDCIKSEPFIEP